MAIAIASLLSYGLHRTVTFRSDPYVRWVRMPGTFLVVAVIAVLVDVVVLRSLFAAEGFTTAGSLVLAKVVALLAAAGVRSEEHTSELQSLMRISYAVFCLKKKNKKR